MDLDRRAGLHGCELRCGELGEQRMDAEPASALEADDEEVGALELGQHRRRVGAVEHCIAQRGREAAEHGSPKQERANVVAERAEDLVAQVLGHEALVPSEVADRPTRVVDRAKPERRERERRRPALGAVAQQRRSPPLGQIDTAALDEELVRLRARERKLARAQLGKGAAYAQTREPKRRGRRA